MTTSKIYVDTSRWTRRGLPGLSLWDPSSLDETDLLALNRFRRQYVDLKPTTDADADAAAFAAFFRAATDAWIWVRDGQILGIGAHRCTQIEIEGRSRVCIWSDYGFIAERGRPLPMLAQAWVYVRTVLRHPFEPSYLVGFCYPHSYLAFAESTSNVWLLGQPDFPAAELAMAEHMAAALGASRWDPASHVYDFPTLPRERVSITAPRRAELLARYEAVNPHWRAGRGAFMFIRLELATFGEVLTTMGRRSRRLLEKRRHR